MFICRHTHVYRHAYTHTGTYVAYFHHCLIAATTTNVTNSFRTYPFASYTALPLLSIHSLLRVFISIPSPSILRIPPQPLFTGLDVCNAPYTSNPPYLFSSFSHALLFSSSILLISFFLIIHSRRPWIFFSRCLALRTLRSKPSIPAAPLYVLSSPQIHRFFMQSASPPKE